MTAVVRASATVLALHLGACTSAQTTSTISSVSLSLYADTVIQEVGATPSFGPADPNILVLAPQQGTLSDWKLKVGRGSGGRDLYVRVSVRRPTTNLEVFHLYSKNPYCKTHEGPSCRQVLSAADKGRVDYLAYSQWRQSYALSVASATRPQRESIQVAAALVNPAGVGVREVFIPRESLIDVIGGQKLGMLVTASELSFDREARELTVHFEVPRMKLRALFDSPMREQRRVTLGPAPGVPTPRDHSKLDVRSKPKGAEVWALGDYLEEKTNTTITMMTDYVDFVEFRKAGFHDCDVERMSITETSIPQYGVRLFCELQRRRK
jgi:hypothetical protein